MTKIKNRFEREAPAELVMPTQDKVERSGYRTTREQVNQLIRAGERLAAYRNEMYTGVDRTPDGSVARHYGEIDIVDAHRKMSVGQKALRSAQEAFKASQTPPKTGEVSMGTESSSSDSAPARTKPGTKGEASPE